MTSLSLTWRASSVTLPAFEVTVTFTLGRRVCSQVISDLASVAPTPPEPKATARISNAPPSSVSAGSEGGDDRGHGAESARSVRR